MSASNSGLTIERSPEDMGGRGKWGKAAMQAAAADVGMGVLLNGKDGGGCMDDDRRSSADDVTGGMDDDDDADDVDCECRSSSEVLPLMMLAMEWCRFEAADEACDGVVVPVS